jgi:hypothetical protein
MRMLVRVAVGFVVLASHVAAAGAGQLCETVPMPCTFEAPPFSVTVIDADTKQPLPDVHGLAEWQMYGGLGRLNGPVMALSTVSGPDGVLRFPGWGPIQGSVLGLGVDEDPVVTLFKSGYRPRELYNRHLPMGKERERVRPFRQDGETFTMEVFRGTPEEWLESLGRVAIGRAVPRNDEDSLRFREAYLSRLRRVSSERSRLPLERQPFENFFWHVDRSLKFLEEGHR